MTIDGNEVTVVVMINIDWIELIVTVMAADRIFLETLFK